MVLETTYKNKKHTDLINDIVGKPFSLIQILKFKGIGSKRMVIENSSVNLKQYLNTIADINYANIELRPGGILVLINKGLQSFTWVIPYYQLVIYKTNGSSLHAQGKFVHFKNNRYLKENKYFFNKLMNLKIRYDKKFQSPTMS